MKINETFILNVSGNINTSAEDLSAGNLSDRIEAKLKEAMEPLESIGVFISFYKAAPDEPQAEKNKKRCDEFSKIRKIYFTYVRYLKYNLKKIGGNEQQLKVYCDEAERLGKKIQMQIEIYRALGKSHDEAFDDLILSSRLGIRELFNRLKKEILRCQ